jgi:hypothetical protein
LACSPPCDSDGRSRQQTLKALIDWSYDLLEASRKTRFRAAVRIRGRYDARRRGKTVCADATLARADVLNLLDQLVQKFARRSARARGSLRFPRDHPRLRVHSVAGNTGKSTSFAIAISIFLRLAEAAESGLRRRKDELRWLSSWKRSTPISRPALAIGGLEQLKLGVDALRMCGALAFSG